MENNNIRKQQKLKNNKRNKEQVKKNSKAILINNISNTIVNTSMAITKMVIGN